MLRDDRVIQERLLSALVRTSLYRVSQCCIDPVSPLGVFFVRLSDRVWNLSRVRVQTRLVSSSLGQWAHGGMGRELRRRQLHRGLGREAVDAFGPRDRRLPRFVDGVIPSTGRALAGRADDADGVHRVGGEPPEGPRPSVYVCVCVCQQEEKGRLGQSCC